MGLVTGMNTFTAGTTATASEVNTNFTKITDELNGSIEAANIADGAVSTAKIANSAVDANKVGAAAIRETHVDYTSANSGVKVPRVPGYLGANGGTLAVVSHTFTRDGTDFEELTIGLTTDANFSPATAPTFTAAPTPAGAPCIVSADEADIIVGWGVMALSASSMTLYLALNGDSTNEVTVSMLLWGPE